MGLYSAMLAGVAGLKSNSTALAAISENIANVNTVGYKDNAVSFQTLVTNTGNAAAFDAGGVQTTNQQFVTNQGSATQTSSPTDLAIAGQGMFVTSTTPTTVGPTSQVLFTRAGSFTTDSSGFLKNSAGLYLMGWPVDGQGSITTSSSLSSLAPININTLSGQVSATTNANVTGNLNSAQTVSTQAADADAVAGGTATPAQTAAAYNPTTNSMTAYNATTNTGVKPDFTMQIPVSDSQGGQHTIQVDFLRSGTANTWYAEIQAVPASDVVSGSGLAPGQISSGTVSFNQDGSINMAGSTLFGTPTPASPSITIGASSTTAPGAGAVNWATALGVSGQTVGINLDSTNGNGGVTQLNGASNVQQVTTNGTTFGALASVSVDKNGIVTATFDNGTSRNIAQIAMATFPNENGLQQVNGNAYQTTAASGNYNLKTAGAGGAGTIASSSLEASTVDLSTQFTDLITTQSAYSAASKVITTADNMTNALLAIIQG